MTRSTPPSPSAAPRPPADQGSVLVDALVALGILTITLTLASQAVQAGLQRSRRQEEVRMAQLVARSHLAEVGADIPLAAGRTSGQDGPLAWTVTIEPEGVAAALWAASVEVESPDGSRLAELQTLRPAAP